MPRRYGCVVTAAEDTPDADLAVEPDDEPQGAVLPRFLHRVVTPEAVYGLVLYATIVAAASTAAEAGKPKLEIGDFVFHLDDAVAVLIWVVASVVVFWAAHVFAHAVAAHGIHEGEMVTVGEATQRALQHSAGMLYAPILPTITIVLGALDIIPDGIVFNLALWISVGLLGILGFLAFTARRAHIGVRLLGGLVIAGLGLVIIIVNSLMH